MMALCCVDVTIGARIIAVFYMVTAAIVVMQLSTELAEGKGEGNIAVLLGLSLDEFDASHFRRPSGPYDQYHHVNRALDKTDRSLLVGFLVFGLLHMVFSGLLAYSSIVQLRWGACPWLFVQAISFASQASRLVVQVARQDHLDSPGMVRGQPAIVPHPHGGHPLSHPERKLFPWDHNLKDHQRDDESGATTIAVSIIHMVVSLYVMMVVLVAQREWVASKPRKLRGPAIGDEDFVLAEYPPSDNQRVTSV